MQMPTTHLDIEFFSEAVKNEYESARQGRPIFRDVEMVRIRIAGDKGTVLVAPANEKPYVIRDGFMGVTKRISYAEAYPDQYAAFKAGLSQAVNGTPIEEATFLTAANRAELKAVNVFTIEALAGLEKLDKLGMNGTAWRDQARAYLKRAEGSAIDGKLIADNETLKRKLEIMEEQMRQLLANKSEAGEPSEASAEEVDKPGPFFGYTAKMLREFIKEKSGESVKGNPKLGTLLSMAEEALAAA